PPLLLSVHGEPRGVPAVARTLLPPVTIADVALATVTGPGGIGVSITDGAAVDSPPTRQVTQHRTEVAVGTSATVTTADGSALAACAP
ncbi:hypothetical protein, partial [Actinotalea sp.]|uniref:hypothetical protein n=1 Tax=Actinotalea sp. TaxID=1872145 RepID=UPI00356562EE